MIEKRGRENKKLSILDKRAFETEYPRQVFLC